MYGDDITEKSKFRIVVLFYFAVNLNMFRSSAKVVGNSRGSNNFKLNTNAHRWSIEYESWKHATRLSSRAPNGRHERRSTWFLCHLTRNPRRIYFTRTRGPLVIRKPFRNYAHLLHADGYCPYLTGYDDGHHLSCAERIRAHNAERLWKRCLHSYSLKLIPPRL